MNDLALFNEAFEAALSAHVGYVPEGTAFLSHGNSWEIWESGVMTHSTDIEEEADRLYEKYKDMYWRK